MATSTRAATLIDAVAPTASPAQLVAHESSGQDPDLVVGGLGASRIEAIDDVGGESSSREIAKLGAGRGAPRVADGSSGEEVASTPEVRAELTVPTCACGCKRPTKRATQTNAKTGARKGEYQRYLRGHGAYQQKLKFVDLTPEWLETFVNKTDPSGHWLADVIQVTGEGRRVYVAHIALALRDGPVTAKALDHLRGSSRCRRCRYPGCISPSHRVVLRELEPEGNIQRRAEAIEAALARMRRAAI
jgi:hypothetical protein